MSFDASQTGTTFQWGVVADIAGAPNTWVVVTEVPDENSSQRYRSFALAAGDMQQDYWFATGRRFGAQKYFRRIASPGLRFAVWAPHAQKVEVVFAPFDLASGTPPAISPTTARASTRRLRSCRWFRTAAFGSDWESPALANFDDYLNRLYMYRITNEQGTPTYKVDIFSRNQVGRGATNPGGAHYTGFVSGSGRDRELFGGFRSGPGDARTSTIPGWSSRP